MLRNLLQREGFADLDAVRDQGRADALRGAVRALCEVLDVAVDAERARHIDEAMLPELESLLARLRTERRWPA